MPPIDVIEVSGLIDPVQVDFVGKAIDRAERDDVQALVIQLNSRKAVVDDDEMAALIDEVADAKVPIAIWVGPSGSRAYSESGQLLVAADVTGISPGSRAGNFGDALDADAFTASDKSAIDKYCCSSLGAAEAVDAGVVDLNSPVLGQFIVGLDGIEVDGTTLHTSEIVQGSGGPRSQPIAQVRFSKLDLLPRLLHTVASPPVAYLLLTIGLVLLVFEFFIAGRRRRRAVSARCSWCSARTASRCCPPDRSAVALILFADARVRHRRADRRAAVLDRRRHCRVHRRAASCSTTACRCRGSPCCSRSAACCSRCSPGMPAMVRTRFATPTIGREWMIGEMGTAVVDVDPDGVVRGAGRASGGPARTGRRRSRPATPSVWWTSTARCSRSSLRQAGRATTASSASAEKGPNPLRRLVTKRLPTGPDLHEFARVFTEFAKVHR